LYIVSQLTADQNLSCAVEEPGNADARLLFNNAGARIIAQPVDEQGMIVDHRLRSCDIAYVTPSHQIPTAVAMSMERRRQFLTAASEFDFVIVEDDYECETYYSNQPLPALRSMDTYGRVVYVGGLSKVLAPGICVGFIVANPDFIRRARHLRRMMAAHPPLNNQRALSFFLSLGHYDALVVRLGKILQERRMTLRDALSNMRGVPLEITPEVGGTTYWVQIPKKFNVSHVVQQAAEQGILLEPVERYYAKPDDAKNCFRMGVTSIKLEKIVPGIKRLVTLIRHLVREQVEHLESAKGEWLTGEALSRAMAGATIFYKEVYGTVCTIKLHVDGSMTGVMGKESDDWDKGTWRVEGDYFFRQWDRWNYAAQASYFIVVDGKAIKYFNSDRQIVDSAIIELADNGG
jgi:GntR family transcriptional regulator/MocR family aminotransferase